MRLNRFRNLVLASAMAFSMGFVASSNQMIAYCQETTGGLQGTVKDPSGAVVPKAKIVVSGSSLIGAKEIISDASGYYRVSNLPSGTYTVSVKAEGFKSSKREGVTIQVGHQPTVDVTLQLGDATTTVEVNEEAPVIDTTTTQNLTNLSGESLQNLPTGTSFQSVIQFAPMAHNEPLAGSTGGTGGSMPGSSGNGNSVGYSIGGAADSESAYLIEGQDTENISGGYSNANVPMDFIQEVQIKTSGISSEYGGALGGVINVVMKKGSNDYHGGLFTTYRSNLTDSNQFNSTLRYDPNGTSSTVVDPTAQQYQRKADSYTDLQPGFYIGGPVLKNRLWFFAGIAPMLNSVGREVDFTSSDSNAGKLNFTQNSKTYYTNARLDYALNQKVRLSASWLYQYTREMGDTLPVADPIASQSSYLNTAIDSPITSYAYGYGFSAPNATWNFGADITLTQKLVSTTRFGYFFQNYHDFGWQTTGVDLDWGAGATTANDNAGNPLPSTLAQAEGTQTSAYNETYTKYNASKHIQLNQDFSYYISSRWGTHNIRAGYQLNHLSNVINQNGNVPLVYLYPGAGKKHSAMTSNGTSNCALLKTEWGYCAGQYGWAEVQDFSTILTTPAVDWNHAFYGHDSWTMGHGLTLDLGLRIEKESLPAPDGAKVSAIDFSWADKIEPRVGAAWDPTQKGKMKLFGSYGVVNDVMKLLLAQTSWGAQAYEDCYYPLGPNGSGTFADSDIDPVFVNGRGCPSAASNVGANFNGNKVPTSFVDSKTNVGLIENVNWRAWEPVAPSVKPYRQHEFVVGYDYEVKPGYSVEVRYDRRRLDHVIEDASLSDVNWGETYTVVNPGEGVNKTINSYASYLSSLGEAFGVPGWSFDQSAFGTCTSCPANPKAIRNYDGAEFRLTMNPSAHWSGMVSYTYSKLWGNYTGLTTTDQIDGGSTGRNSPDTTRAFDEPFYYFKYDGKSSNGPLPTDRPNTFKGNIFYQHRWNSKHTSNIGLNQNILQGSPVSSYIDLGSASSTPLEATYIWGRGNWVNATSNSSGNITLGNPYARRTPWFFQSDIDVSHEIKLAEGKNIKFMFTATNAFNNHSVVAYWGGLDSNYFETALSPTNSTTGSAVTMSDGASLYQTLETGYSLATPLASVIQNSQYGKPNMWQQPRNTRFEVHYNF
ncbi:carboxypeptidase regulatory-like domain-containing protein [Telmatobacter bradus]|uniref:TonB-dependent receptor n=1 Tax=Telmatobacter bradus TaxID=474953 RepID=UPI003B43609E